MVFVRLLDTKIFFGTNIQIKRKILFSGVDCRPTWSFVARLARTVVMTILFLDILSRNLPKLIVNSSLQARMHSMAFITAPDEEVAKNIAR